MLSDCPLTYRWLAFCLLLSLLLLVSSTAVSDDGTESTDRLFSSHDDLSISLNGPFMTLNKERDVAKAYDGQLSYPDEQGNLVELRVGIKVRGNYRRDKAHCDNPPLRVINDTKKDKSSLFSKLKDVKLVIPCNNSRKYQRFVIMEYLIYRMYNQLSALSYRVRLVEINLVNSEKGATLTFPAFFIEPHRDLAKRLDKKKIDVESVDVNELEPEGLAMLSLFQYMISNTDYSPIRGAADENCCHNVKLYRGKDNQQFTAIPYDFDFAGLVNATYAIPNPKVRIRSVRARRYRGYCGQNDSVRSLVAQFNSTRESIEELVALSGLTDKSKSNTTKYLARFFETVNDPKKLEKNVLGYCR